MCTFIVINLGSGLGSGDVHIQCDQHFQFGVFEILVLFSFDLVFGPVE